METYTLHVQIYLSVSEMSLTINISFHVSFTTIIRIGCRLVLINLKPEAKVSRLLPSANSVMNIGLDISRANLKSDDFIIFWWPTYKIRENEENKMKRRSRGKGHKWGFAWMWVPMSINPTCSCCSSPSNDNHVLGSIPSTKVTPTVLLTRPNYFRAKEDRPRCSLATSLLLFPCAFKQFSSPRYCPNWVRHGLGF